MRRLAAVVAVAAALAACSAETSFREENGVCYRTRTNKVLGIQTSEREVQSVAANCRGE